MSTGKNGEHRCGFVACLGRTNVGKSTLINRLLGQKLGIVSRKPQTTRRRVKGILNLDGAQVILVDTPGLHEVDRPVNRSLAREARQAADGADCIMVVTDPLAARHEAIEGEVLRIAEGSGLPSLLVMNKADLLDLDDRRDFAKRYDDSPLFSTVMAVSAKTGENLLAVTGALVGVLPAGPSLYPGDQLSDQPERDFFAEILREKIFRNLHRELPYTAAVVVEDVKELEERDLYRVQATIYVERDSQKGILIGAGGSALRRIGTAARKDMEALTGSRVYLSLWVKVRKNWTKDPKSLREFGFEEAGR